MKIFRGLVSILYTTARAAWISTSLARYCDSFAPAVITWSCMRKTNHTPNFLPPLVSAESWAERIKLGISPRASLREQFSKLAAPCYSSTDRFRAPIPGTESRWRHRRCWCSKSWADLISALLFLQKMSPRRSRAMPPIALLPRS